jgi:hypothetical protein
LIFVMVAVRTGSLDNNFPRTDKVGLRSFITTSHSVARSQKVQWG